MNFKPTKWKVIVSIAIIIIWYVFILVSRSNIMVDCMPCTKVDPSQCEKFFVLNIIPPLPSCGCTCPQSTPLFKIFEDLLRILFPGILIYLVWSLFEKKNKKR